MKTAVLIEGFSGGPLHTRNFRHTLGEAGFRVVKDKNSADVVIAHSAGIYAVPHDTMAKVLLLIGPTYWPNQPLFKRFVRHARSSGKNQKQQFGWKFFIWTRLKQFFYFFARNKYLWLGIKNNNRLDFLDRLTADPGRKIIIVRNQDDDYCSPEIENVCKTYETVRFVTFPGQHEDFVTNPKPYIDLLLKEL